MKSKLLTGATLALTLAIGVSTVTPRNANAFIVVDEVANSGNGVVSDVLTYDPAVEVDMLALGCLVLLPFCLLDQKTKSATATISTADLLANGYTANQVNQIQQDQATLVKNLHAAHARLEIRNTDTKASFEHDIRTMLPNVSQTYLDFATATANLK